MDSSQQTTNHLKAWGFALALVLLLWTARYCHLFLSPWAAREADASRFWWDCLLLLAITLVILACIFLPAVLVGAFAGWLLNLSKRTELLIVLLTGFPLFAGVTAWYVDVLTTHPTPPLLETLKIYSIYFIIPLSLYWHFTRNRKFWPSRKKES